MPSAGDTILTMPDAVITAAPGSTLPVGDFIANAACPPGGSGCNGAMTLAWNFDVQNVNFQYGFGNPGDITTLTAFDSLMNAVGVVVLTLEAGASFEDLSALGVFRSPSFDNTAATGAGYAFGNVNFDRAAVVPLPAALLGRRRAA